MTSSDRSQELLAIADRVIAMARPDELLEAYVGRSLSTDVRIYEGEVEHFVSAQTEGIGIRVIRNGRTGTSSCGTLDPTEIAEVLAEARDNLEYGEPDEWAGMAEPDGVPVVPQNLWNEALAATTTARKIELAKSLERLTLARDPRVRVDDSNYSDAFSETAVATTTGIRVAGRENGCYLSVGTLADDGDETQTGFGFAVGRDVEELDVERAASEAVDRATRLLGATKPDSRRLTVVLDPFVTAQFLGIIGGTLSGESVVKGRSLFAERIGEQVATPLFTLVDDPTNPLAYTATDIDGEGLAARRNVLIENGTLKMFVQSSYSARRMKTSTTGNGVRGGYGGSPSSGCLALQIVPGSRTQEELIGGVDDGILIQQVQGLHSGVNPVSGDFSTGAAGILIKNGTLGSPVREFTIASTLQRMLQDIAEVGGDLEWLPMRATGVSLVIHDVTMSGA
ncbi:MAG: TldD/PmbA family protein [Actinomycetota bacterium]